MMNLWECGEPGCKSKAVGSGGAIGLRAVGWHFAINGGPLRCPAHRPDQTPCTDANDNRGKPCSLCPAEMEANRFQTLIGETLAGKENPSMALAHILFGGQALCGQPGVPADWPAGDRWVNRDDWTAATCNRCKLNYATAGAAGPRLLEGAPAEGGG